MNERIDLVEIARQACGMPPAPVMECADEAAALAQQLQWRTAERDCLISAGNAMAEQYEQAALKSAAQLRSERDAWCSHYKRVELENAHLICERDALQARLDAIDMRELVGKLREIYKLTEPGDAERLLRALLRRIDQESQ